MRTFLPGYLSHGIEEIGLLLNIILLVQYMLIRNSFGRASNEIVFVYAYMCTKLVRWHGATCKNEKKNYNNFYRRHFQIAFKHLFIYSRCLRCTQLVFSTPRWINFPHQIIMLNASKGYFQSIASVHNNRTVNCMFKWIQSEGRMIWLNCVSFYYHGTSVVWGKLNGKVQLW